MSNLIRRSESASKDKYSIDEEVTLTDEEDDDDMKPSPFQRSARKSMHIDDDSLWEKWQTKMKGMNIDDVSSTIMHMTACFQCSIPVNDKTAVAFLFDRHLGY